MPDGYSHNSPTFFEANKWPLIAFIFVVGILFLVLGYDLHKDYPTISLVLHLLGAFLFIAVPLEILRELFYEKANIRLFSDAVDRLFDAKIDACLIEAGKFGLERIEGSLHPKELFDELKPGDTLWWLDTFCPGHKSWIDNVEQAMQKGAFLNMLIPDPKSPLCRMRAEEIGGYYEPERFEQDLKMFIADFNACRKNLEEKGSKGNINIVLYNDLLGVPCYVVTRETQKKGDFHPIYAYSSMYLTKPTGVDFPHFRWGQGMMSQVLFNYVKLKYDKFAATTHS